MHHLMKHKVTPQTKHTLNAQMGHGILFEMHIIHSSLHMCMLISIDKCIMGEMLLYVATFLSPDGGVHVAGDGCEGDCGCWDAY
jgi:hypothetical protein